MCLFFPSSKSIGRTPLTGGGAEGLLARASTRSFGSRWIRKWSSARSPTSFRWDPRGGSHVVTQQLLHTPDVIRQSRRHGRCAFEASVSFSGRGIAHGTQFVMDPTEVIGGAQQIHAGV